MIRRLYERIDDWLHPKRTWTWRRLRAAEIHARENSDEYQFVFGNGVLYLTGLEAIEGVAGADTKRRAIRVFSDTQRKIRATKESKRS